MRISNARVLMIAKAINGPCFVVPETSRYTLDELREVKWGFLSYHEQQELLLQAEAALVQCEAISDKAVGLERTKR